MPSRPRLSKVAKPNGNTRNRKPLPDAGLQELEHQYVVANANVNGHASIGTSVSLGHGQLTLAAARGSAAPKIDSADGCANFPFASQSTPYPMPGAQPSLSALELAFNKYGDAVKIDSALCKKVAGETAKRMPTQRRPDQKLNIDRRSNMEAFLAHVTGQVASKPCKNCHKGHGPWSQCVVYDGQMCGSCTNCWYNASGSRCTYHGNGTAASPAAVETPGGDPADGPDETSVNNLPYYSTPKDESKPVLDWTTPHHDEESNVSSQSQPHVPEPFPGPHGAYLHYHQQPPPHMPHGLPSVGLMPGGGGHGMATAAAPRMACDSMGGLVRQAMRDVSSLSRRDRYVARIETAAEELAMRWAEFEEYMRTPEAMADQQQHFHETTSAHMMPPGHAHDARMETIETESVHGGSSMS
ncbi:hypothetical protein A9K55_007669 [Cordyceps militaris]|uniref:Uncharacterized protein n=1 Tax=Cordyceps militaris TaxID=73501 RepID=A0A2H4SJY5_CORMI|nr:hypothetical protein A9K55_007669 [Cordyceps militaris]